MPGRCDKSFANTAAFGGAYRNILQIGFIAGKPARHGYGLRVISVHPPGCGIHHARELVRISGFKLGKTAIIEQRFCQRIIRRQTLQHVFVRGGRAPRRFFEDGKLELVEQYLLNLLWSNSN